MARHIRCSACGKKIYEGGDVFVKEGLIYQCCSLECLARCLINYNVYELNDYTVKNILQTKWEGE